MQDVKQHAAAKLGSKVLMITQNLETIARMSSQSSNGGVAKGQILEKLMPGGDVSNCDDESMIQFRMLTGPRVLCGAPEPKGQKLFEKWR